MSPATRRAIAASAIAAAGTGVYLQLRRTEGARVAPQLPGRHREISTADGTSLQVTHAGPADADAAIVLVHGWAMDTSFWRECGDDLATDCLVVAYDQRGHGRSGDPGPDGATLAVLGHDLVAVLATVPAGMPILLVGHSMGAMTVLSWAATHHDDRVAGAVLCSTGAYGLVPALTTALGQVGRPLQPVVRSVLTSRLPLAGLPPATLRGVVGALAHGPSADRRAVDRTTRLMRASRARVRADFGREMAEMDLRPAMADLTVPTVVVVGTRDRLTPPVLADELVAGLPDARLHVIEAAGHQLPLDVPDLLATVVREHLASVLATRPAA